MTIELSQYLNNIRDSLRLDPVSAREVIDELRAHIEDRLEEGERLKERIASAFNCVELWLTDFSPVMAYAAGSGVLAVWLSIAMTKEAI